jgi:hypothetical protein
VSPSLAISSTHVTFSGKEFVGKWIRFMPLFFLFFLNFFHSVLGVVKSGERTISEN